MARGQLLEAVVNVSEGRDPSALSEIGEAAGALLLDAHSDPHHNRSVFTLAGGTADLEDATLALARRAVALLDISWHEGAHPRLGVVDVVPFVPFEPHTMANDLDGALAARARFAEAFGGDGVPCFFYGPERLLPSVRKEAFVRLIPDAGPALPHATAGACCVGARPALVAYNLVIGTTIERARDIARAIRGPSVRALGLTAGEEVQVSVNLVDPLRARPDLVYDEVAALAPIERPELVGLVPATVLDTIPEDRWTELGLSRDTTVEARLEDRGG